MSNDQRIDDITELLSELIDVASRNERTAIFPNAEVINANPGDLPTGYIIIKDDEGHYGPAVTVAGLQVQNGDLVNLIYIKGTEPIAFQHGAGSSALVGTLAGLADVLLNNPPGNGYFLTYNAINQYWYDAPASVGGSGGYPFNIITVDATDPDADFSTLAGAIAASSSGDTIKVGPGTYACESIILPDNVNLIGSGSEITFLVSSSSTIVLSAGANCRIKHLSIENQYNTGDIVGVEIDSSGVELYDLNILTFESFDGEVYGVNVTSGSAFLHLCHVAATEADGDGYAVRIIGGADVVVFGGHYEGKTGGVFVDTGASVLYANAPVIAPDPTGSGSSSGAFEDIFGELSLNLDQLADVDTSGVATGDILRSDGADWISDPSYQILFGDGPQDSYQYSRRPWYVDDFGNNVAGFEGNHSSPYPLSGAFSLSLGGSSTAGAATFRHFLRLLNSNTYASGTLAYLQWTDSSGLETVEILAALFGSVAAGADEFSCELRVWDVQSPSGSDPYSCIRWRHMASTYPTWPWRVGLWYGTGVTFSATDGTMVNEIPYVPGLVDLYTLKSTAATISSVEAYRAEGMGWWTSASSTPTNGLTKTARLVVPGITKLCILDHIRVFT